MIVWWESLTTLEHLLLYLAVPATLVLLIQTVLLFMGGLSDGDGDADGLDLDGDGIPDVDPGLDLDGDGIPDLDLDGDGIPDVDLDGDGVPNDLEDSPHAAAAGLHILTLRGIIAFLTLFGWGSLWLCQLIPPFWALFLGVQMGILGMVGIAFVVREAVKLQYDGTLDIRNAVGQPGTVYLTIPPSQAGAGKVNVLVQDQLREFEAFTNSAVPLPTGAEIVVTGLLRQDVLLVAPKP